MKTIKDCAFEAMTYCGLDEARKEAEQQTTDLGKKFTEFAKAVIFEIASSYARLKEIATVKHEGGVLEYSALGKNVFGILSVERNGCRVVPKFTAKGLDLPRGTYEITFAFLPELTDESELPFGGLVNPDAISLGTASRYFLTMGMAEEATAFDEKFKEALKKSPKNGKLPCRQWL